MQADSSPGLENDIPPDSALGWIAQQIVDADGEVPIYHFKLQGRERPGDRWSIKCDIRRRSDDTPERIHDRIEAEGKRQHCVDLRVIATTRQSQTPMSTYPWTTDFIGNPEAEEPIGAESTGADKVVGQSLRHNEAILQALMRVTNAQLSAFASMQAQAKAQIDTAHNERIEMMVMMREMYLEKDAREIEGKKWDALTGSAKTIAQAVAYKFTQGKVAPDAKANILDDALIHFGQSMSEEQVQALSGILNQEQLVMLNALTSAPADTAEKIRKAQQEAEHEAAIEATKNVRKKEAASANT